MASQGDDDLCGEDLNSFDLLAYQHALLVVVELIPDRAEGLHGFADLPYPAAGGLFSGGFGNTSDDLRRG